MLVYEIVSAIAFLGALAWALKKQSAFYLAALVAGFSLFIFDWIWVGRDFFNATFNQSLVMIPGLDIYGQRYPWAVAFNWSIGFGLLPLLFSKQFERNANKLGAWHFPIVFLVCAIADMFIEEFLVTVLGVYTYHQADSFLVIGVPWSSLWFGGGLMALPYFSFHYVQKWLHIDVQTPFSLRSEESWKACFAATAALWVVFFAMTIPQTFWYSLAQPWVESGRLF
jgi:hypothetical protein